MPVLNVLLHIVAFPFPWAIRRLLFVAFFGYKIHPTARIARLALIAPRKLKMAAHAQIGPLTVAKGMDLLELGESATIGSLNWIYAFPTGTSSPHFQLDTDRKAQLVVCPHAAITSRHIVDCTDEVSIGAFTTFAGFRSQILTHSINLTESRQRCKPVRIGEYCFIGTGCVLLGGSKLPDRSVLGAQSLLNKEFQTPGFLYGGVPAQPLRPLDPQAQYFSRHSGYVV